ncbi:hypothetical protein ACFL2V_13565 [Pseudomonadota bacterium]
MQILLDIVLALIVIVVLLLLLTAVVNLFIRVPYVPSKKRDIKYVLDLANLKDNERVYDLGCGDGRFLFAAEKSAKISGTGYEAAPIPYLLSHIKKFFLRAKSRIHMKNFFKADLSDADVVFCYLGPDVMKNLADKLKKECKKGTRIFSNTFHMEGLEPATVWEKNSDQKHSKIYLYRL